MHQIRVEYLPRIRPRYTLEYPHPRLYQIINRRREVYKNYLRQFMANREQFFQIGLTSPDDLTKPVRYNGFFEGLDAFVLYGMMSVVKPPRYLEVGSGNSTKFARQAVRDFGLETTITSIDPWPRVECDEICDNIIRTPLEETDLSIFNTLRAGDILFMDGSHYLFQNSDVNVFALDVMPYLKPGIYIQIHDIHLPYDYPADWDVRLYTEQYMLAATLLAEGPKYEILFPNFFVAHDPEFREILAPIWDQLFVQEGMFNFGSFWMRTL